MFKVKNMSVFFWQRKLFLQVVRENVRKKYFFKMGKKYGKKHLESKASQMGVYPRQVSNFKPPITAKKIFTGVDI